MYKINKTTNTPKDRNAYKKAQILKIPSKQNMDEF